MCAVIFKTTSWLRSSNDPGPSSSSCRTHRLTKSERATSRRHLERGMTCASAEPRTAAASQGWLCCGSCLPEGAKAANKATTSTTSMRRYATQLSSACLLHGIVPLKLYCIKTASRHIADRSINHLPNHHDWSRNISTHVRYAEYTTFTSAPSCVSNADLMQIAARSTKI